MANSFPKNTLIFMRCDSSTTIGTGHVMRSLTIANELRNQAITVSFVCKRLEGSTSTIIENNGFPIVWITSDEDWINLNCNGHRPEGANRNFLLIDHYNIDHKLEAKFKRFFDKIIVIDDLLNRIHSCDLFVDPNQHSTEFLSKAASRISNQCRALVGPQFALIRPEFLAARLNTKIGGHSFVKNPLIFFGGTDPKELTIKFLSCYKSSYKHFLENKFFTSSLNPQILIGPGVRHQEKIFKLAKESNITIHLNPDNVAKIMSECDFYFGSGGTVTYERMCLGLTGFVISVVDNQEEISFALAELGAHTYLGKCELVDFKDICSQLLYGLPLPIQQSEISKNLVDGLGSRRVVTNILAL